MKTEKEWKKALNVTNEEYSKWESNCQDQSLTLWALKHKKIPLNKYMNWAVTHYSIPYLKDSFLHTNPMNSSLWDTIKDSMEWNKTIVPLYSWEGKIFIGCVEPPKINNNTCVPLLTSPKILEFCWNKIQKFSDQEKTQDTVNYTMEDVEDVQNMEDMEDVQNMEDMEDVEKLTEDESLKNTANNTTILGNISNLFNKKNSGQDSEKVYNQIFSKTKKYFSSAVVLSFKNQKFTSLRWTKSIKETSKPIDVKEPSLFRMLVLSNTPHHGTIVSNNQHEECFKEWGYSKLPKHVSLIPLHNKSNQLCGAFLGVLKSSFVHRKYLNKIIQTIKPLKEVVSISEDEELLNAA